MPDIRSVRTYGNPVQSPGQPSAALEPGRFPDDPYFVQPGHSWETQFVGYEPSVSTIVRDRHGFLNRGNERFGRMNNTGAGGAGPDPMKDGPARPSLRLVNRTFNPQQGTTTTAAHDDLTRGYRTVQTGQWAGQQDGATSQIWGGSPGLYSPYGSYGGYTQATTKGIQGPEVGSPGDGPQLIPNSPPHGLHSETMQNMWPTVSRFNVTSQQRPGRVDRPANSPIAGQSFSQTILGQNQIANRAGNNPENSRAGFSPYLAGSNWRGV
jgi:hypothetical protein